MMVQNPFLSTFYTLITLVLTVEPKKKQPSISTILHPTHQVIKPPSGAPVTGRFICLPASRSTPGRKHGPRPDVAQKFGPSNGDQMGISWDHTGHISRDMAFFLGWTRYNSLYEIIMGIYYELLEHIVGIK